MIKFNVLLSPVARKFLDGLENKQRDMIKTDLINLEENPFRKRPMGDIKKLEGHHEPNLYRIRIGNCRSMYFVVGSEVKVTEMIKRGKGYEWLD